MKFLLLLLIASCAQMPTKQAEIPAKVIEVTKPVLTDDKPYLEVTSYLGYNKESTAELKKAVDKVNKVVGSQCFEKFMIDRAVKKPGRKYTLHSTNGRTAKEVVDHLRSDTVKIRLVYYKGRTRTVGYTYANTDKVWTNWKFYAGASACNRGSNLAHEGSHKAPFSYGHTSKATYSRPWSVPYSINEAFKYCCR